VNTLTLFTRIQASRGNQRDLNRWGGLPSSERVLWEADCWSLKTVGEGCCLCVCVCVCVCGDQEKECKAADAMRLIVGYVWRPDSHVNHERSEEAGSSLTAQSSVAFHRRALEHRNSFSTTDDWIQNNYNLHTRIYMHLCKKNFSKNLILN